jgi:hypothetical protein
MFLVKFQRICSIIWVKIYFTQKTSECGHKYEYRFCSIFVGVLILILYSGFWAKLFCGVETKH